MDKIVHFEIPADQTGRAKQFYESIFGWQIIDATMPGMEYFIARTVATDKKGMPKEKGGINGGLQKRQPEAPAPVLVISVKSIDAALEKVLAQGGAAVGPKMPIGQMGFYARFKDPEGNIMGLWEDAPKTTV